MDDYLLKVKVQNNKIISLMKAKGIKTVAELARASGIYQTTLGDYINMTKSPLLGTNYNDRNYTDKPWSAPVLKLADFFGVLPDEMFNEQQLLQPLETNKAERSIKAEQMQALIGNNEPVDTQLLIEDQEQRDIMMDALKDMPPKFKKALELRYGLGDEEAMHLDGVGDGLGVTRERARQIVHQATEMLKYKLGDKGVEVAPPRNYNEY